MAKWIPSEHPRDKAGQFADKPQTGAGVRPTTADDVEVEFPGFFGKPSSKKKVGILGENDAAFLKAAHESEDSPVELTKKQQFAVQDRLERTSGLNRNRERYGKPPGTSPRRRMTDDGGDGDVITDADSFAVVELTDEELDAYLEVALAEQFTKPGTANISPSDRAKLKGLLAKYGGPGGVTRCIKDQMKHGLSKDHAGARCAVLKDEATGSTMWRGKGKHKKASELTDEERAVYLVDLPEEWIADAMEHISDMHLAATAEDAGTEVALADSPETYFQRFMQALRSTGSALGQEPTEPQLNSPQQAADFFSRLGDWIRQSMRMSGSDNEMAYPLAEDDDGGAVMLAYDASKPGTEKCKQGDTVSFNGPDGESLRGIVTSVSGEKVTVKVGGKSYTVTHAQIKSKKQASGKVAAADYTARTVTTNATTMASATTTLSVPPEHHKGYLTPLVSLSETTYELAADGSKLFWKQIIPLGKRIKYGKGTLKTDKEFLSKLAENINSGKYPAPFVAVNKANEHDETPEQARGMIKAARLTKNGLDVKIEPRTEEAATFLTDFPEVPVSAFYDEDYTDRGTGEHVGPRLFHVAATWRPWVNGMSPMELVAASDQGAEIIDLTGEEYTDLATPGKEETERELAFDESKHPRGKGGRFVEKLAGNLRAGDLLQDDDGKYKEVEEVRRPFDKDEAEIMLKGGKKKKLKKSKVVKAKVSGEEPKAGYKMGRSSWRGGPHKMSDADRKEAGVTEVKDTETREGVELTDDKDGDQPDTGTNGVVQLTQEQWDEHERRLEAAEAKAEAEAFARLSERTLSYLRSTYSRATEAQVKAAHAMIVTPGENGSRAVKLSDTGEVSLADKEEDARGDYVTTLLEGCNAKAPAPRLGEDGTNTDASERSDYEAAQAEARQIAKDEGRDYQVVLSEVMNKRASEKGGVE